MGRQIRWSSVGRAAAIAAAAIAGVAALPALLGGDRPPPVPADVGLVPPPAGSPVTAPAGPPAPDPATRAHRHRPAKLSRHVPRSSPRRPAKRRHGAVLRPSTPSLPVPAPPAYSYALPPSGDNLGIEGD